MSRNLMLTRRAKSRPAQVVSDERRLEILRRPIITEKATLAQQYNVYAFEVAKDAKKAEIKDAVEQLFSVSVIAVNTASIDGKRKRFRGRMGRRNGIKKAYVRLSSGQTLDIGLNA